MTLTVDDTVKKQWTNAPWHSGTSVAGKTFDWMPTDTEENYQKMVQDPKHAEYFKSKGWDQPGVIEYRINQQGFRCDELDPTKPSLLALGCSYTAGIGLPEKDIWPSLVANELNLTCYNLAWGGTSADTCFTLAEFWIPELRPKLVVMAAPPMHRFDLFLQSSDIQNQTFMPGTQQNDTEDFFVKNWFLDDRNAIVNNAKNKLAVQAICQNLEIPCLTYNAHEYFARSREEVEYARDYMHAGPKGHRMFAERILDDWRKKYA